MLGLQLTLAGEDLGHNRFRSEHWDQVLLTQLSLSQQRLHELDATYSRNHNVFALPAFYQPAEQREIGFLRWRSFVRTEQVPDLNLQTNKVCFGFDRPRSVSGQQSPVLIVVETRCHASGPPCCIRRVSAPREGA